ncbi:MAG: hypothetical protein MRJ92_05785 [Nitrospira sp.]|nr:hypothetical protein [Nitrospira sp.]
MRAATTERAMLADIQRAALRQDSDAVAGYLRRVQEWPADVWILRWGALLCTGIALPQLAIPFWERILSMEEDPYARIGLAKHAGDRVVSRGRPSSDGTARA